MGIAPRQSDVQTSPSNRVVAESGCCAVASLHAFKSSGDNVNTFYLIILIVLAFGGVSVLILMCSLIFLPRLLTERAFDC